MKPPINFGGFRAHALHRALVVLHNMKGQQDADGGQAHTQTCPGVVRKLEGGDTHHKPTQKTHP